MQQTIMILLIVPQFVLCYTIIMALVWSYFRIVLNLKSDIMYLNYENLKALILEVDYSVWEEQLYDLQMYDDFSCYGLEEDVINCQVQRRILLHEIIYENLGLFMNKTLHNNLAMCIYKKHFNVIMIWRVIMIFPDCIHGLL